jgi:hypothetical protein
MDDDSQWKTEEYHDHDMHVLASYRGNENPALPGPGAQWDFTLHVTPRRSTPDSPGAETARSDPESFYPTQAMAENMGFLKGRDMIEGRAQTRTSGSGPAGRPCDCTRRQRCLHPPLTVTPTAERECLL